MKDIKTLIRSNILSLKPYSSARDEFKGKDGIFLDANENPFYTPLSFGEGLGVGLNRYPDPYQKALKEKLSSIKNIATENIFVGNGSDEVIDLAFRIFCNPGKDKVIVCPPTYGMYEVSANINDVEIIPIPLDEKFQVDVKKVSSFGGDLGGVKIIFLCSPNNPTGNSLENIETIIQNFNGIVFVDEAYIDFSAQESVLQKVNKYPNLIVSQTLSKAWGRAAIRVGIAYASKEIISYYNKVKPPYNVSQLNQYEAIDALSKIDEFQKQKDSILSQREWLKNELSKLSCIKKIYPSDANFLLVEVSDADVIYSSLVVEKIVTRNRNLVVKNCIRITVGTEEENKKLIQELKNY